MGKGKGTFRPLALPPHGDRPDTNSKTAVDYAREQAEALAWRLPANGYSKKEIQEWQNMMERAIKENRIKVDEKGSYYMPLTNEVSFTSNASDRTYYHEFGHMFDYSKLGDRRLSKVTDDYFLGSVDGSAYQKYRTTHGAENAFKSDLKKLARHIGFSLNSTGSNITGDALSNRVILQKWWSKNALGREHMELSDIISAMTSEKSGSYYVAGGHPEEYWNRRLGNRSTEVFANYMSMRQRNDRFGLNAFKRLTPNLYQIMQKRYKNVMKGK